VIKRNNENKTKSTLCPWKHDTNDHIVQLDEHFLKKVQRITC